MALHSGSIDPQPEHRTIKNRVTYGTWRMHHEPCHGRHAWNCSALAACKTWQLLPPWPYFTVSHIVCGAEHSPKFMVWTWLKLKPVSAGRGGGATGAADCNCEWCNWHFTSAHNPRPPACSSPL